MLCWSGDKVQICAYVFQAMVFLHVSVVISLEQRPGRREDVGRQRRAKQWSRLQWVT